MRSIETSGDWVRFLKGYVPLNWFATIVDFDGHGKTDILEAQDNRSECSVADGWDELDQHGVDSCCDGHQLGNCRALEITQAFRQDTV
jgi:hypothetical protein